MIFQFIGKDILYTIILSIIIISVGHYLKYLSDYYYNKNDTNDIHIDINTQNIITEKDVIIDNKESEIIDKVNDNDNVENNKTIDNIEQIQEKQTLPDVKKDLINYINDLNDS